MRTNRITLPSDGGVKVPEAGLAQGPWPSCVRVSVHDGLYGPRMEFDYAILGIESLHDDVATLDLRADPVAPKPLGDSEGCAAAAERVEHELVGLRRKVYHPLKDLRRELIGTPFLALELPMPNGWDIGPDVREVNAVWVHRSAMPSVVLDLAATVTTDLDRRADPAKRLWLALRVVQETVMSRIQSS